MAHARRVPRWPNRQTYDYINEENHMNSLLPIWTYYTVRFRASLDHDRDRGEVSATTVVLAAALIALAIAVGVIITNRVSDKANTINLG